MCDLIKRVPYTAIIHLNSSILPGDRPIIIIIIADATDNANKFTNLAARLSLLSTCPTQRNLIKYYNLLSALTSYSYWGWLQILISTLPFCVCAYKSVACGIQTVNEIVLCNKQYFRIDTPELIRILIIYVG